GAAGGCAAILAGPAVVSGMVVSLGGGVGRGDQQHLLQRPVVTLHLLAGPVIVGLGCAHALRCDAPDVAVPVDQRPANLGACGGGLLSHGGLLRWWWCRTSGSGTAA